MLARIPSTWRHTGPIRSVQVRARPEGERIPLLADWPRLLDAIRDAGEVVLQVRHRYGRLIGCGQLPALSWDATGQNARGGGDGHALDLHTARWAHACGRVRTCARCCSPGGIFIHDHGDAGFLQICPPARASATRWAHLLDEWRSGPPLPPASRPPAAAFSALPVALPASARPLGGEAATLLALLQAVIDQKLAIGCALETAGARQYREFVPRHLALENGLLILSGDGVVAQVILPVIAGLALDDADDAAPAGRRGGVLHLVNADGSSLLSVGPASGPPAATRWRTVLRSAFAGLR
ncbi:hypothetical protein OPIT5_29805 [Opitutaceae bacterium TAV5]|nr:hypothetical protein OPIT5_29805 [Opitutaceae bacterium TAV5]